MKITRVVGIAFEELAIISPRKRKRTTTSSRSVFGGKRPGGTGVVSMTNSNDPTNKNSADRRDPRGGGEREDESELQEAPL